MNPSRVVFPCIDYLYEMKTKELILSKVKAIEDECLLEEILKLINLESDLDKTYKVSDEQRAVIDEGLLDIKEGRIHNQKEADELTKKWLTGS